VAGRYETRRSPTSTGRLLDPSKPARTDTPPARTEALTAGLSTLPARTDTPPVSTDTPPARADTTPARTDTPPARTDTPPARTDTPPARTDTPPARTDTPPARSHPPPARAQPLPARAQPLPARAQVLPARAEVLPARAQVLPAPAHAPSARAHPLPTRAHILPAHGIVSFPMTKPTAVLIHSGGFTSRQWRKLGEALAPTYRVLAPDLLGYGASGPWPDGKPFHFHEDIDFLESLLSGETEPVHLIGHSYGGLLALQLTLRRPELVRSIAAYEPVAVGILDEIEDADARAPLALVRNEWHPDPGGADEPWLRAFVEWWNGPGAWDRLAEETRAAFRAVGWKLFQEVITLIADRTDRATYATITAPTLILGGAESPLTERRVVEKLGAALPRGEARFFPGVGHMGPISHAALVNAAIAEHLGRA
jgi:pimeloyl-ACP methyl ester carboxylesterase